MRVVGGYLIVGGRYNTVAVDDPQPYGKNKEFLLFESE